ncbi:hypothetical protein [Pontibacter chinhatensis]|uniref:Uncharacterized protein n=1 Tax=Pontibacter chinhatensis TaxID=1436961 RepID=A0A1I2YV19_9BACT|nr:hypothetical protein [Pontibacter chinhatensis]SFH29472.1 hypothetical protein SAMN05421739_11026 [Pontibacter chinhatensis]
MIGETGIRLIGSIISLRIIFSIVFLISLSSCSKKVRFNKFEHSLLEVYNEGDTLVFQSNKGELDTVYIVDKDIGHARWNPLVHSGIFRPLSGKVYSARERLPNGQLDTRQFISLYKDEPDSTSLYIFFDDIFLSIKFKNNPSVLMSILQDSTYKFQEPVSNNDSNNQEVIYWHVKHGVVKYTTKEGTSWICISCPASDR